MEIIITENSKRAKRIFLKYFDDNQENFLLESQKKIKKNKIILVKFNHWKKEILNKKIVYIFIKVYQQFIAYFILKYISQISLLFLYDTKWYKIWVKDNN